jgi:hypothetical protein
MVCADDEESQDGTSNGECDVTMTRSAPTHRNEPPLVTRFASHHAISIRSYRCVVVASAALRISSVESVGWCGGCNRGLVFRPGSSADWRRNCSSPLVRRVQLELRTFCAGRAADGQPDHCMWVEVDHTAAVMSCQRQLRSSARRHAGSASTNRLQAENSRRCRQRWRLLVSLSPTTWIRPHADMSGQARRPSATVTGGDVHMLRS